MVKWEYLFFTGGKRATVTVRHDKLQEMAQYLLSALPNNKTNVEVEKQQIIIEKPDYVEVCDVLGEAGWEMIGEGIFKRPKP